MPTLFDPSIVEAAHPGSNTDRLYACQGTGADRDRWIERLDLFTDQMPGYVGGLGAPAHDTASVLDTTSSVMVLDENGAPKKAPIDYIGIRGYRVPSTGTHALKWFGATGAGSSSDAGGSVVTGGSINPRTGLTLSGVYPSGQGMMCAHLAGMAVGDSSVVSSSRAVTVEIPVDTVSTDAEDQIANLFYSQINQLAGLSFTDKHVVDAIVFNQGAAFGTRIYGQIFASSNKISLLFKTVAGADYTYADMHTLRGAYAYVFLRFKFSGML